MWTASGHVTPPAPVCNKKWKDSEVEKIEEIYNFEAPAVNVVVEEEEQKWAIIWEYSG